MYNKNEVNIKLLDTQFNTNLFLITPTFCGTNFILTQTVYAILGQPSLNIRFKILYPYVEIVN